MKKRISTETGIKESGLRLTRITAPVAILAMFMQAMPVFPAINNTVTVNANGPSGALPPQTANESVDVADDAPVVQVVKTFTFAPGGDVNNNGLADAGDSIIYNYVVTNTGNVTLSDVNVTDILDNAVGAPISISPPTGVTTDNGSAAAGQVGDSNDATTPGGPWDRLGPLDVITFTATYVIQPGDISGAGGGSGPTAGDNDIDSTAQVTGTYVPAIGPAIPVNDTDTEAVPLNVAPLLFVDKVASDTTDVAAGDVVTYTYTVRNDGNVPLTNVVLSDTHKGVVGALTPAFQAWVTQNGSTVTGNTINTLNPGAEATFTASYTVVQSDIDNLQ